jgi:hypothetical protein
MTTDLTIPKCSSKTLFGVHPTHNTIDQLNSMIQKTIRIYDDIKGQTDFTFACELHPEFDWLETESKFAFQLVSAWSPATRIAGSSHCPTAFAAYSSSW